MYAKEAGLRRQILTGETVEDSLEIKRRNSGGTLSVIIRVK